MSEQSESPFFPVPVRWFEIPMNTARWGLMRLTEVVESTVETPPTKSTPAQHPVSANFMADPNAATGKRVGQILNERA
jgi:hypothetical protein